MALAAILEFGDNKMERYTRRYLVQDCQFDFNRSYTEFGPSCTLKGRTVEISVVAPGKTDLNLFEWFTSQSILDGRILFSTTADDSSFSEGRQMLLFEGAQCLSLSEVYDKNTQRRRTIKLRIIAESFTIDGIVFT